MEADKKTPILTKSDEKNPTSPLKKPTKQTNPKNN